MARNKSTHTADTIDLPSNLDSTAIAPAGSPSAVPVRDSKMDRLVALLRRPEGARIDQMMQLTGWQSHSVRGALAGTIKKKLGLTLISEKLDGERVYHIMPTEADA